MKENKRYRGNVEFEGKVIFVMAKNLREATKKIKTKAVKVKPKIDNRNTYVDEF